jgi:Redoxin
MLKKLGTSLLLLWGLLLTAACGSTNATQETTITTAMPQAEVVPTTEPQAADSAPSDITYNGADWTRIALTNAQTGETFTFADFAGKTVFVHPMARWCTNCRASQSRVRDEVFPQMDSSQFVFVSLTVETSDTAENMAVYANDNQFPWVFSVMPTDLLAALSSQLGASISNPPTQPHFIIRPDGTVTALMTGSTPSDELIADLNAANSG